eukprot:8768908-Pyramimonas_sp.AAC.1
MSSMRPWSRRKSGSARLWDFPTLSRGPCLDVRHTDAEGRLKDVADVAGTSVWGQGRAGNACQQDHDHQHAVGPGPGAISWYILSSIGRGVRVPYYFLAARTAMRQPNSSLLRIAACMGSSGADGSMKMRSTKPHSHFRATNSSGSGRH